MRLHRSPLKSSLLQTRKVIRKCFDVCIGQRLRGGGHLAIHVEARGRLEAAQLRAKVIELLSGEPRYVLLSCQLSVRDIARS